MIARRALADLPVGHLADDDPGGELPRHAGRAAPRLPLALRWRPPAPAAERLHFRRLHAAGRDKSSRRVIVSGCATQSVRGALRPAAARPPAVASAPARAPAAAVRELPGRRPRHHQHHNPYLSLWVVRVMISTD